MGPRHLATALVLSRWETVAYSWDGGTLNNFDIYVKEGSGDPRRLTTEDAVDFSPSWSPDGGSIAFFRRNGDTD